jgi:coiled-coil domain-containing protein 77
LRYKRENDLLKIKEMEDRKKISELLSLTEPIEEEIVLTKDIRPEITTKFVNNDLNIHKNKENYDKALKK